MPLHGSVPQPRSFWYRHRRPRSSFSVQRPGDPGQNTGLCSQTSQSAKKNNGSAVQMTHSSRSPPAYIESAELTAEELLSPSPSFRASVKVFFELVMLMDGKEMISRMLRTGESSLMTGRNRGKQAPTMPSEDSTMGQYRVGVKRSFQSTGQPKRHYDRAWKQSHTCEILVSGIGFWRLTVVSGLPRLTIRWRKNVPTAIL